MPAQKMNKTDYKGVFYIDGISPIDGKPEKIFYIRYRKNGKYIDEKAGRQGKDSMTPARASKQRALKMAGKLSTNKEKREAEKIEKLALEGRWTIKKLWKQYKKNNPNLKGMVTDENRFKNHIEPTFGKKEPSELLPLDVDRLRLKLLKEKSPGTVKNVLELLRRISNYGIKKNLCDGPKFRIELPKVNNIKTEDLSPEQLKALLESIEKDKHPQAGNIMKMALYTGMRRSELFRLKWDDIDYEKGFILIRDPKGGVDQRIPLNDAARKLLKKQPKVNNSVFIFPGRKGHQRTDINHQVKEIKIKAGLPKNFRALHGLRHVYASMLASSGKVDLYTLQKLLTHKSPMMTQRYAHLRDDALKAASNLAGDIITQAAQESAEDEGKAQQK